MNNIVPPPYHPKPKRNSLKTIVRLSIALLAIAGFSMAVVVSEKTICDLRIPWSISLFVASVSGMFLWRRWRWTSGYNHFFINLLIHIIFATGLLAGIIFSINYFFSDKSSESVVRAEIVNTYSKTRYHTRRIGRRLSGRGNPYQVYFVEAVLPDGRKKEFSVTLSQFNEARQSKRIILHLEKGLLSMPVIKESSIVKKDKQRRHKRQNPHLRSSRTE